MSSSIGNGRGWGARVLLLGASMALGGCFSEDFGQMDDDDEVSSGSSTSGVMPGTDDSGDDLPGTTGEPTDDDESTGEPTDDGTTGGADESTDGGSSESGDEDTGTSTGVSDETTGEVALTVDQLVPGDLVVTEVMSNPHCGGDSCEWIEILNNTELPVNLLDLYIQDNDYNSGNQGRVTVDLIVESGDVAVIARGTGVWPYDFTADAVYGPNPGLNNGSPDRVVLVNAAGILDETSSFYDGDEGFAWSLSGNALDTLSNDDSDFWCPGVDPLPATTTTEYGTPGQINPPC